MIHHVNGYTGHTDRLDAQIAKGMSLATDAQIAYEAKRRGLHGPAPWVRLIELALAFASGMVVGWFVRGAI